MENLLRNKKVILVCLSLLVITGIIFLITTNRSNNLEESNTEDYKYLKNYSSNEFIPVYITEEDMAKKYLNEYKNDMLYNVEDAYNSLNEAYREKRFGSLEKYKEYVNGIMSLSLISLTVDKYSVSNRGTNKIFNIYDESGYQYIFKEISIMNYEVYLDEYTVEIE